MSPSSTLKPLYSGGFSPPDALVRPNFFEEISGKILPPHDLKSLIFIGFQENTPNGIALSAKEKLVE